MKILIRLLLMIIYVLVFAIGYVVISNLIQTQSNQPVEVEIVKQQIKQKKQEAKTTPKKHVAPTKKSTVAPAPIKELPDSQLAEPLNVPQSVTPLLTPDQQVHAIPEVASLNVSVQEQFPKYRNEYLDIIRDSIELWSKRGNYNRTSNLNRELARIEEQTDIFEPYPPEKNITLTESVSARQNKYENAFQKTRLDYLRKVMKVSKDFTKRKEIETADKIMSYYDNLVLKWSSIYGWDIENPSYIPKEKQNNIENMDATMIENEIEPPFQNE